MFDFDPDNAAYNEPEIEDYREEIRALEEQGLWDDPDIEEELPEDDDELA